MLEKSPGFDVPVEKNSPVEEEEGRARRSAAAKKGAVTKKLHKAVEHAVGEDAIAEINARARSKERAAELQRQMAPGLEKALAEEEEETDEQALGRLEKAASGVLAMGKIERSFSPQKAADTFKNEMGAVRASSKEEFDAIAQEARDRAADIKAKLLEGKMAQKMEKEIMPEPVRRMGFGDGPKPHNGVSFLKKDKESRIQDLKKLERRGFWERIKNFFR